MTHLVGLDFLAYAPLASSEVSMILTLTQGWVMFTLARRISVWWTMRPKISLERGVVSPWERKLVALPLVRTGRSSRGGNGRPSMNVN